MNVIYPLAFFVGLPVLMWLAGYMAENIPDYWEDMTYWWLQEADE